MESRVKALIFDLDNCVAYGGNEIIFAEWKSRAL